MGHIKKRIKFLANYGLVQNRILLFFPFPPLLLYLPFGFNQNFLGFFDDADRGNQNGKENTGQEKNRRAVKMLVRVRAAESKDHNGNGNNIAELPGKGYGFPER